MSDTVSVRRETRRQGDVAFVSLAREAKLNSLSSEAMRALVAAMRALSADAKLRAVVVTGAGGRAFCGGASLEELAALDTTSARAFISRVHEACATMRDCPLPVIARVNGWCLGAGLELMAACDLRIAAAHAMFGMPEVRLGIPSVVEAALLPRLVGAGRARWLVMTGEAIDATTALAWGLVEKVVPADALDAAVDAALEALLAAGPQALRVQKRLCHLWEEAPLDAAVAASIDEFARAHAGDEPGAMMHRYLLEIESRRKGRT